MSCVGCNRKPCYHFGQIPVCGMACALLIGNKKEAQNWLNAHPVELPQPWDLEALKEFIDRGNAGKWKLQLADNETLSISEFGLYSCTMKEFVEGLRELAKGGYGAVYSARAEEIPYDDFAIKVAAKYNKGTFSSADNELRMTRELFSSCVLKQHSPHLPIFYGGGECSQIYGAQSGWTLIVTRQAYYGSAADYFESYAKDEEEQYDLMKQLIFEMAWTLSCLKTLYGNFSHNDIKMGNILADVGPAEGYTVYTLDQNTSYTVPNSGVRFVLADFGLSTVVGAMDNEVAMHNRYGVHGEPATDFVKHRDADITMVVLALMDMVIERRQSITAIQRIIDTFGDRLGQYQQSQYWPPMRMVDTDRQLLSVDQMLKSTLFDQYRTLKGGEFTQQYVHPSVTGSKPATEEWDSFQLEDLKVPYALHHGESKFFVPIKDQWQANYPYAKGDEPALQAKDLARGQMAALRKDANKLFEKHGSQYLNTLDYDRTLVETTLLNWVQRLGGLDRELGKYLYFYAIVETMYTETKKPLDWMSQLTLRDDDEEAKFKQVGLQVQWLMMAQEKYK